ACTYSDRSTFSTESKNVVARREDRAASLVLLAVLCCGCGGGGGESASSPPPVPTPPPVSNTPPAPPPPPSSAAPPNRTPIVANPIVPFPHGIGGHAFSYDFTQGGTTFADPDADTLRYEVWMWV